MNFDQLLAFYEVARQRSFTRAAKNLAISQPAVTRRIFEMERAYNAMSKCSNVPAATSS